VCDQLTTESSANNVARMQAAEEAILELVKNCMRKLTTTMNHHLQGVAKGQPAPALGQPEVPTTGVIVARSYYQWALNSRASWYGSSGPSSSSLQRSPRH